MNKKQLNFEPFICITQGDLGRGLFLKDCQTNNALVPNALLFHEKPCEAVPMLFSQLCCQLCTVCLRPLQTLQKRLNRLLNLQDNSNTACLTRQEEKTIQQFELAVFNFNSNNANKVHLCKCKVCHTPVCSRICWKSLQRMPWHRVVCHSVSTALDVKELTNFLFIINSWKNYVKSSQRIYEGFLLVARLLCRIADSYETQGLTKAFLTKSSLLTLNQKKDIYYWAFLRETKKAYHKKNPKTVSMKHIEDTHQKAFQNFILLEQFFKHRAYYIQKTLSHFTPFLFHHVNIDFTFYMQLLVQLELVNVQVALEDPNYDFFLKFISSNTIPSDSLILYQKIFQKATKILYPTQNLTVLTFPELLALFFHEIHGYSYCPIIGLMNHSCLPNVSLDIYRNHTKQSTCFLQWSSNKLTRTYSTYPLLCKIVSIQNIRPGDELLLSYIDETQPLVNRCRQLKVEYGFVCRCSKCIHQAKHYYKDKQDKTE